MWYFKLLINCFSFKGRASGKELFFTFSILFMGIRLLEFSFIFLFIYFIVAFSALVRRLHDLNFSGWMSLIVLIPGIDMWFLGVLLFADSNSDPNKYGISPKARLEQPPSIGVLVLLFAICAFVGINNYLQSEKQDAKDRACAANFENRKGMIQSYTNCF